MDILLVGVERSTVGEIDRVLTSRGHVQTLADTSESALRTLQAHSFPLVVVEDSLPDSSAAVFCRRARAMPSCEDAVILVIAHGDEQLGPVLDAGATDLYFTSLGPAALETRLLIAERLVAKQADQRMRDARFRRLFESGVAGVTIADLDGNFKEANDAFLKMLGYTREEMLSGALSWVRITPPDWLVPDIEANEQLRSTGFLPLRERAYVHKDGRHIAALVGAAMLADTGEYVTYVTDLTEKRAAERTLRIAEEQLHQAQKLEALGNVAGGVAHDFNNLLSVILSYGALVLEELDLASPARADVEEILQAGERATDLTRQLLAFSSQQMLTPKLLALDEVLLGMEKMLRRLVREDIELAILRAAGIGTIRADVGQIERVVTNLIVNARDAMPLGGKLTIELANVDLDESYASSHHDVKPGPHVMLAVSDTGTGMDGATRARMFEPFFTTKAKARGTGLGLSTLFGIVKQSGGHIWVYSELGVGTTLKVYFPRIDQPADALALPSTIPLPSRGTETVLLAEDDDQVRQSTSKILRRHGYAVLEATNGADALVVAAAHYGDLHMLLTDVVMPEMGGQKLAARLAELHPHLRVLYMSGYTDDTIVRHGVLEARTAFIQKPVTPLLLLTKMREILDPPWPPAELRAAGPLGLHD